MVRLGGGRLNEPVVLAEDHELRHLHRAQVAGEVALVDVVGRRRE
jgi:hypothetical protein